MTIWEREEKRGNKDEYKKNYVEWETILKLPSNVILIDIQVPRNGKTEERIGIIGNKINFPFWNLFHLKLIF